LQHAPDLGCRQGRAKIVIYFTNHFLKGSELQERDVRCWFAPADMRIGAKILDSADEAIRLQDKLLLVISQRSLESEWVEDEVTKAFSEERDRGGTVVFPVRIDDALLNTDRPWAVKLRKNRHIGDFSDWENNQIFSAVWNDYFET
jgi:hypothetical protein